MEKEESEIRQRIVQANKTHYLLLSTFRSRDVHRTTKLHVYRTIVRPIITYGCETWVFTKKLLDNISTFRRILGPVNDKGLWRFHYILNCTNHQAIRPQRFFSGSRDYSGLGTCAGWMTQEYLHSKEVRPGKDGTLSPCFNIRI